MKRFFRLFRRIVFLVLILIIWWLALTKPLSDVMNLTVIIGCLILVFPVSWAGRKSLDKNPANDHLTQVTTAVHYVLVLLFGLAIIRAVITRQDWSGWTLPIPSAIGLILGIISGLAALLSVVNLALKGLGAPFAIALSRKLTADWMYARTRNPMVLSTLIFLLSLGLWFRSAFFVLWVVVLFAPALLFFVKVYEERELELRFGASYLEYKSRTPMLFPGKSQ